MKDHRGFPLAADFTALQVKVSQFRLTIAFTARPF